MNSEARVISAIVENKDMAKALVSGIDDMFDSHADVWRALKNYYFKYKGVPPFDEVNQKFPDMEFSPTGIATGYAIDEMRNEFATRRSLEMAQSIISQVKSGKQGTQIAEDLQKQIAKLGRLTSTARDLDISDPTSMHEHIEMVKARTKEMGGTFGIPTGFRAIDASYLTGMAPGHLIVVIGWPGRGKTWMTGYLAVKAWERGFKPMIVSLEMSPEVMRDRLYTMMGDGMFSMEDYTRGKIDIDQYDNWSKEYFSEKTGFIIVSNEGKSEVTPSHIQAKIDQHRPDLVIIDYHQLMSDNQRSKSPIESNRNISLELKRMALRNSIPIIDVVSATMSDVSDQKAPPMLSQVAWSKAIEYDADHALAVHRVDDEGGHGDGEIIEIVCRKNRHGTEYDFFVNADLGRGSIKETYE